MADAFLKQITEIRQELTVNEIEPIEQYLSEEFSKQPFQRLMKDSFFLNLFRYLSKEESREILIPAFFGDKINEKQLQDLLLNLYNFDSSKLAKVAQNLFHRAQEQPEFLQTFPNVVFPNIYQHFISSQYCQSGSNLIKAMIDMPDLSDDHIKLIQSILVSFILHSPPFIDEFRQYISSVVYRKVEVQPIPKIKEADIQPIFSYLTSFHLDVLNHFLTKFEAKKEELCIELANNLIQTLEYKEDLLATRKGREFLANQALQKELIDALRSVLSSLPLESLYECEDVETDLLYRKPHDVYFTIYDIRQLDELFQSDSKNQIIPPDNKTTSLYHLVKASFRINKETHLPSYSIDDSETLPPEMEARKSAFYDLLEEAQIKRILPEILFKEKKATDSQIYLQLLLRELEKKKLILDQIRKQLRSKQYIDDISPVIDELQNEALIKYIQNLLENQAIIKDKQFQKNVLTEFYQPFLKTMGIPFINELLDPNKNPVTVLRATKQFPNHDLLSLTYSYLERIIQYLRLYSTEIILEESQKNTPYQPQELVDVPQLANDDKLITMFQELQFSFNYRKIETSVLLFKKNVTYAIPPNEVVQTVFLFHQIALLRKDVDMKLRKQLATSTQCGSNLNIDFIKLILTKINAEFPKEAHLIETKLENSIDLCLKVLFPIRQ